MSTPRFLPRQDGRHAVVTGAGTGIGRAIALRLAQEGARVSLLGRRVEPLHQTARLVAELGGRAAVHPCDIRDEASVRAAFAALEGPIDVLCANAGVGGANVPGPEDRFLEVVQTNLMGTYWCVRAAQERLAPGPAPRHIVVTSSVLGRFGVPGYTAYCASKTGLIGLVRALALELASQNVLVNAICPGWVGTEMAYSGIQGMADGMGVPYEEAMRIAMSAVPLRRMATPEEIAGMVAWLVSPDAAAVTGQALDQNGGSWMG